MPDEISIEVALSKFDFAGERSTVGAVGGENILGSDPLTAITKGQHWHNSKWEQFIVVHGHGLIQERNINTGELVEFEVTGDKIEAIYMIQAGRIRFLRKCDFHGHLQENMDGIMRR